MKKDKDKLNKITASILKARSQGVSEERIAQGLKKHGYTLASYNSAIKNQTKKEDKGEGFFTKVHNYISPNNQNGLMQDLTHAQDSLTWGGTVYLRAGVRALGDKMKTGEWNYDKNLKREQDIIKEYEKESPISSTVADIAGGIGGALIPVGGASRALGLGKFSTSTGGKKVVKDVVGGGVTGGVVAGTETASIATARGDEDVESQTVMATGAGGVLGGGLPLFSPVLVGAKKITSALADNPKITKQIGEGWDQFRAFFVKDGKIDPNVTKQIKEHEDLDLAKDMTTFDLMDESAVRVVSANLRNADPTSEVKRNAYEFLRTRLANTKDQVSDFIGGAMNFPKRVSTDAEQKMFRDQARERSKPYYQKAYFNDDKSYKTIQNAELDDIFLRPDFMEAYRVAHKQSKNSVDGRVLPKFPLEKKYKMEMTGMFDEDGNAVMDFVLDNRGNKQLISDETVKWPVWALDTVKKHLDRKYKYAGHPNANPSLTGSKADISILKKNMIDIVEVNTDNNYKVARAKYQGQARLEEALEDGGTLFKPSLNSPNAKNMFKKLKTEDEKTQFRVGAYNSLVDVIERSGDEANPRAVADLFKSKRNIQKLELIVPDAEERGKLIRRLEILGERIYKDKILVKGSQSASNLTEQANAGSKALQAVGDVANKNVTATARNLENLIQPNIVKAEAEKGSRFAFNQGSQNVRGAIEGGEGLLVKEAMQKKARDPLNLLGFTTGASSGSAQQYDN
tara:strand:- start:285 stop:2501 length:2217 start_codon:yes stop_codon:yes gene_type:complete